MKKEEVDENIIFYYTKRTTSKMLLFLGEIEAPTSIITSSLANCLIHFFKLGDFSEEEAFNFFFNKIKK